MKTQNLIKQTLSQPESVVVIQQILEDNKEAPRSAIAKRVCQHFEFFNALGKPEKRVEKAATKGATKGVSTL